MSFQIQVHLRVRPTRKDKQKEDFVTIDEGKNSISVFDPFHRTPLNQPYSYSFSNIFTKESQVTHFLFIFQYKFNLFSINPSHCLFFRKIFMNKLVHQWLKVFYNFKIELLFHTAKLVKIN